METSKRDLIGATGFAVLLGLAALCYGGWRKAGSGSDPGASPLPPLASTANGSSAQSNPSSADERIRQLTGDLDKATAGREAAEAELAALRGRLEDGEGDDDAADPPSSEDDQSRSHATGAADETARLRNEVQSLEGQVAALEPIQEQLAGETAAKADLAARLSAAENGLTGLRSDLNAATKRVETAESQAAELPGLRNRISGMEGDLEALRKEKADLTDGMAAQRTATDKLRADLEKSRQESEAGAKALADVRQQLADSKKAMSEATGKLETDLAAAKKKGEADARALADLRKKFAAAGAGAAMPAQRQEEAKQLQAKFDALEKKAAADAAALADALTQVAALQRQIDEAGSRAMNDRPAIGNRAALGAGSRTLLARLDDIRDNPAERERVYREIAEAGDAQLAASVLFEVGSDFLSRERRNEIDGFAGEAPENVRFLVVGYASTEGDADVNSRLSRLRAKNVAARISEAIGDAGRVETIFYGQTKRFSAERLAPNRVVEVWQLKK